jgi:hypothetical protein
MGQVLQRGSHICVLVAKKPASDIKRLLLHALGVRWLGLGYEGQPQFVQHRCRLAAAGSRQLLVKRQGGAIHDFSLVINAYLSVDLPHQNSHFGLDLGLVGHAAANLRGRLVQNFAQHRGVFANLGRWAHALKHLLQKPGDLLTFGRFSFSLAMGPSLCGKKKYQ